MNKVKALYLLTLGLCFALISCTNHTQMQKQTITKFFQGINDSNFDEVSRYVADSVVTSEMQTILTKTKQELHQQFQWDSVFSPNYQILEIKKHDDEWICKVKKSCKRIQFLQDTSITCKMTIQMDESKIVKLSTTDYLTMDMAKWQSRRDTLVAWIAKKHPELSGFVYDLTPQGAQNYLSAIDFYKSEN